MDYFTLENISEVFAVALAATVVITVIRRRMKKGFLFQIVFLLIAIAAGVAAGNIIEVDEIAKEKEKIEISNYCNQTILEDFGKSNLSFVLNKIKTCKSLDGKIRMK